MIRPSEDFSFVRSNGQAVAVGKRLLPNPAAKLFESAPRLGMVIGTYGAVPYIELALAVRKRLYPSIPVLIHDDASDEGEKLAEICQRYGAIYERNSSRLGFEMGALSSVVSGLMWAKESGIELLVRMSRRFVPLVEWGTALQLLALRGQFGTYGRECRSYNYLLRPECYAMAVELWSDESVLGEMTKFMLSNRQPVLEENYLQEYMLKVSELNCVAAREIEKKYVRQMPRPAFVQWDFVGPARKIKTAGQLWHETASAEDYAAAGREFGLAYGAEAFAGYWSQAGR